MLIQELAVATSRRERDVPWHLASPFLLRVSGLPFESSLELSFGETAKWSADVLEQERKQAALTESLTSALETRIGEIGNDSPQRIHLINIRRAIFNGRVPKAVSLSEAEGLLGGEMRARIHAWVLGQEELANAVAAGAEVLARELPAKRALLRKIASQDGLRAAILLQSSVLDGQMDRYLGSDAPLDKAGRRIEQSVLEFVYRASRKTSPFSSLAWLAFGEFADFGAPLVAPITISAEREDRIQINTAVLARLSGLMAADSVARRDLTVRMTSGWALKLEQLRYVRRRVVSMGDVDSAIAIDRLHEELFYLPSGIAMSSVLELLPAGHEMLLRDLASRLLECNQGYSPEDVDRYLGHLLRLGVLVVPAIQVNMRAPDPLAEFASALRSIDSGWSRPLADQLTRAIGLIREYASSGTRGRREALRALRTLTGEIFQSMSGEPGSVPKTLVYEDCFVKDGGLLCDRRQWDHGPIADLKNFSAVLPAFDASLARRLLTRTYFCARYGPGQSCEDFLQFAHEYQRDFLKPYNERMAMRRTVDENNRLARLESGMRQAEIAALDTARRVAAERMMAAWHDPQAEEIELGQEFIDAVVGELPRLPDPMSPWAYFVQVVPPGNPYMRPRLVVNQIYSGMTLLFSRFAHALTSSQGRPAAEVLAEELKLVTPPGTVLAELSGGYDTTNLNLHPPVTMYEIVCPGEVSTRPESEQIPVEDLIVVDDDEGGRMKLMSRKLRVEVIPTYLGFLLPVSLPEVQQVLMCFSPQGMAGLDLWSGTGHQPASDRVTSRPRIRFGDVVLQRRTWTVPIGCFPRRGPVEKDSDYFLRVNRWRLQHGLPRHVFARVDFDTSKPRAVQAAEELAESTKKSGQKSESGKTPSFSRKPLAVDFDSWFSIVLLEHLERVSESNLSIGEALPGPDQFWVRDHHGARFASELVIELYRGVHTDGLD